MTEELKTSIQKEIAKECGEDTSDQSFFKAVSKVMLSEKYDLWDIYQSLGERQKSFYNYVLETQKKYQKEEGIIK